MLGAINYQIAQKHQGNHSTKNDTSNLEKVKVKVLNNNNVTPYGWFAFITSYRSW